MLSPSLYKFSLLFVVFIFIGFSVRSQSNLSVDKIQVSEPYENVLIKKLNSDKNNSTFLIYIKKEVKLHKHLTHSETIYVVEGTGKMQLGDKKIEIKKGDVIFIPENTPHSVFVNSEKPLKVLCIQSPEFDGKDRVYMD